MRTLSAGTVLLVLAFVLAGQTRDNAAAPGQTPAAQSSAAPIAVDPAHPESFDPVVRRYCQNCHNDRMLTGNLSLEGFSVATVAGSADAAAKAEKVIRKLRVNMMPPPGVPRPAEETLTAMVSTLESVLDKAAALNPNPGRRTFQRLNRAEYARAVRDLLDVEIDAGDFLPLDTMSANFDNIADTQIMSSTLLDGYLKGAAEISRMAVGNRDAAPLETTYTKSRTYSQWDRVEGAPIGTRGGISVVHNFPADGEYLIKMGFQNTTTGGLSGNTSRNEKIEISIDGAPVLTLAMDQWMSTSDPNGASMTADKPIFVKAGPHRITAAFLRTFEGPVEDLFAPFEWSMVDTEIGDQGYGITALPHMKTLSIGGPQKVTGISDTPSRKKVFSCRPGATVSEVGCAKSIVTRLGGQAYRRPLNETDVNGLMSFYSTGAKEGGFEIGIRTALQAMLSNPDFLFRLERPSRGVKPGQNYQVPDLALASRLSFFLWAAPPDETLLNVARQNKLSDPKVLEAQTRRMLADPRAEALGTRFAAQWLRLQDIELVLPDTFWFPDYDRHLAEAMRHETELFFNNLVQEDRSALEMFTADYTFVNERLARHYGMSNVIGDDFVRVKYPDATRRGLLGHGSVLVLTSLGNRTSPVLRGKWVLEALFGTPPPPPPPVVPSFDETPAAKEGRSLTTRERMELHRSNPTCAACHRFMDPLGLALDNFDVTGKWRTRENGMPLDTRGQLWDGMPVTSPEDLRDALVKFKTPVLRAFTENMLAYAVGRRAEYFDGPTIRSITTAAAANNYRMSSFILGVINSPAFRMQRADDTPATTQASAAHSSKDRVGQ